MDSTSYVIKQYLFLLLLLVIFCGFGDRETGSASALTVQYIEWSKPCRIAKPGEFLHPWEECDNSKGVFCQRYTKPPGYLCGCRIEQSADLSYDRVTRECRRRVGQHCYYVNKTLDPFGERNLGFHLKCHQRAECVPIATSEKSKSRTSGTPPTTPAICQCKPPFIASSDLSQCLDPNGSSTLRCNNYSSILFLVIVLWMTQQLPFPFIGISIS